MAITMAVHYMKRLAIQVVSGHKTDGVGQYDRLLLHEMYAMIHLGRRRRQSRTFDLFGDIVAFVVVTCVRSKASPKSRAQYRVSVALPREPPRFHRKP